MCLMDEDHCTPNGVKENRATAGMESTARKCTQMVDGMIFLVILNSSLFVNYQLQKNDKKYNINFHEI